MYSDSDTITVERIDAFLPCGCEWCIAWMKGKVGRHCVECPVHGARWVIEIRDGAVMGVWRADAEHKNPAEEVVLDIAWAHEDGSLFARGFGLAAMARAHARADDIKRRRSQEGVA